MHVDSLNALNELNFMAKLKIPGLLFKEGLGKIEPRTVQGQVYCKPNSAFWISVRVHFWKPENHCIVCTHLFSTQMASGSAEGPRMTLMYLI